MAHFTGIQCDICGKGVQTTDPNTRPLGWFKLSLMEKEPGAKTGNWDICSDKCLRTLGQERMKANGYGSGGGVRRRYSQQTKDEAAELLRGGTIPAEVERKLDLAQSTISKWRLRGELPEGV